MMSDPYDYQTKGEGDYPTLSDKQILSRLDEARECFNKGGENVYDDTDLLKLIKQRKGARHERDNRRGY